MISGATHTLSGNLSNAGASYRANLDEQRDQARQAAVHVAGNQTKKNNVDAYISSMYGSEETNSSSSSSTDPYEIYRMSMKYARRENVISALDQAGNSGGDGVNILV